jgi:hypothetical protein
MHWKKPRSDDVQIGERRFSKMHRDDDSFIVFTNLTSGRKKMVYSHPALQDRPHQDRPQGKFDWTPYLEQTRNPSWCSVSLDFLTERTEPTKSYLYGEDGNLSSGAKRCRHGC